MQARFFSAIIVAVAGSAQAQAAIVDSATRVPVSETSFRRGESLAVDFVIDGGRVTAMRITPPVGPTSSFPGAQ